MFNPDTLYEYIYVISIAMYVTWWNTILRSWYRVHMHVTDLFKLYIIICLTLTPYTSCLSSTIRKSGILAQNIKIIKIRII